MHCRRILDFSAVVSISLSRTRSTENIYGEELPRMVGLLTVNLFF